MVDQDIADEYRQEILDQSITAYEKYRTVLETKPWRLLERLSLSRQLSGLIADVNYGFCKHSLALATLEEARGRLSKEISAHRILAKAQDYFTDTTKPQQLDYEVFARSTEHIRSHLFVLAQNRYLIYAALSGSGVTLALTHFLRR